MAKLFLFIFIFLIFPHFEVNALNCYECHTSLQSTVRKGGSCFSPDKTTEIGYNCDICIVTLFETDFNTRIQRRCIHDSRTSSEKKTCHKLNSGACRCNDADFCNKIEVPKPANVIDCYKCEVVAYKPRSGDKSCYEIDQNTPIQKDCIQCYTKVFENSKGMQILRKCSEYPGNSNKCSTNEIEVTTCYCNGTTLCNNALLKDPREKSVEIFP